MHVAITGASSGIGEALAREYGQAGASLTLIARRADLLDRLRSEFPNRALSIPHDLLPASTAAAWMERAVETHGPIDVLINNAGVALVSPTALVDPDAGERLLALDLTVPLRLVSAVLPAMQERRRGTIINIASTAALMPAPGMIWYDAAKAGLAAASEALRAELRGTGIHVLTVYPGPVNTELAQRTYAAFPRAPAVNLLPRGRASRLAALIRTAAENKDARVIYPAAYAIAARFPWLSRWLVGRFTPPPLPRD